MICKYCGAQVRDGSPFCGNCGKKMESWNGNSQGVKTLFSDLSKNRTPGTVASLVVFIVLCISSLFSILALALRESISEYDVPTSWKSLVNISTSLWVFLLIFQLAMIVLIILKLDLINVMTAGIGVEGLCMILFFAMINKWMDNIDDGPQGLVIAFMILLILAIAAKLTFVFIHSFTGQNFEKVLLILSISYFGAAFVFSMTIFLIAMLNEDGEAGEALNKLCGIGFGFTSYCIALCAAGVISVFLYLGLLTKTKFVMGGQKTYSGTVGGSAPVTQIPAAQPMIECIAGTYQGQRFSVNGEIVIGSGQGQVSILETGVGVSGQHCRIRFEQSQNCYYVADLSTNGTFVNNQRIQRGVYVPCMRGSIVVLADQGKQYRLL